MYYICQHSTKNPWKKQNGTNLVYDKEKLRILSYVKRSISCCCTREIFTYAFTVFCSNFKLLEFKNCEEQSIMGFQFHHLPKISFPVFEFLLQSLGRHVFHIVHILHNESQPLLLQPQPQMQLPYFLEI
jgi:hypothetical protein